MLEFFPTVLATTFPYDIHFGRNLYGKQRVLQSYYLLGYLLRYSARNICAKIRAATIRIEGGGALSCLTTEQCSIRGGDFLL